MTPALRTLGLIFLLVVTCAGASPIEVKSRTGYTGQAGSRFRFSIRIEPDARNRFYCLEWASLSAEGRTCDTLDAENAPRTLWREVTFRRGGEYAVIAWIRRNDDSLVRSNVETILIQDALGQQ